MNRSDPGLWLMRLILIVTIAIAGYLAYASLFTGGRVAGCGDGAGCGRVLSSRWSMWFGIPVSLPALAVYVAALAATFLISAAQATRRQLGWCLLAGATTLIGGAASWFVGLQLLSLGELCWYCLALHCGGLLLAALVAWCLPPALIGKVASVGSVGMGGIAGLLALAVLIGGQWLSPPPRAEMHITRITRLQTPAGVGPSTEPARATADSATFSLHDVHEHPWLHRQLSLLGGNVVLDMYDHPVLGDRQAQQPIVEIFDYTCSHCRELHALMQSLHGVFGEKLAIVLVPIPLDPACNRYATTRHEEHATACELVRIALAVWQARPAAFAPFHRELMTGAEAPSLAAAEAAAIKLLGEATFRQVLASPAVEEQLRKNCRIYGLTRACTGESALPKLIYDQIASSGEPGSREELQRFLKAAVGGD